MTLDDAAGKNFFDLGYPDELATKLRRRIQQVFDTGEGLTDELTDETPQLPKDAVLVRGGYNPQ